MATLSDRHRQLDGQTDEKSFSQKCPIWKEFRATGTFPQRVQNLLDRVIFKCLVVIPFTYAASSGQAAAAAARIVSTGVWRVALRMNYGSCAAAAAAEAL